MQEIMTSIEKISKSGFSNINMSCQDVVLLNIEN